jgi:hypothetical protein
MDKNCKNGFISSSKIDKIGMFTKSCSNSVKFRVLLEIMILSDNKNVY